MYTDRLSSPTHDQRARSRLEAPSRAYAALIVAVLLVLPFFLFWPEALGLRVFYHHDLQYYFFPYHRVAAETIAAGHLPLWNPYAFSGIPLLADGQTAIFYPPNWLFLLLPTAYALTLTILLHFGIAGAAMFLYLRSLHLGLPAVILGALAFMFNGYLVARVVHPSIMAGAALIPLIFWGVERLLQHGSRNRLILAAAAIALQALTGHPQIPIYTAISVWLYVLVIALQRWRRTRSLPQGVTQNLDRETRNSKLFLQLAVVYLLGYALAAVQLLPWIEFARFSPRAAEASFDFVSEHSITGLDWLLFLFPYSFGGMRSTWLQSLPPVDLSVHVWERLGYIGLLPLALAIIGLLSGFCSTAVSPPPAEQRKHVSSLPRVKLGAERAEARQLQLDRRWALVVVLVVMLLIAAGWSTPVGRVIYALPVLGKLRAYSRAVGVACFPLVTLAAYGLVWLARRSPEGTHRNRITLIAAGALLLLVAGSVLWANLGGAHPTSESVYIAMLETSLFIGQANAYVPLAIAVASVLLLWWIRSGLTLLKLVALLLLVAIDLGGLALSFNPTTRSASFARVPPSVKFLRRDPSLFRIASFIQMDRLPPEIVQHQLAVSWALPYGIQDINGFNSLQPRRYTDFLFGPQVMDVSYGFLPDITLLNPQHAILSMLNVKYVLLQSQLPMRPDASWEQVYADEYVAIYRNPRFLERAYFVEQVVAQPDTRAILEAIKQPEFNPRALAFVEDDLDASIAAQLSTTGPATAQVEARSPNELLIRTRTAGKRFLILSEMWFPGWYAEMDGRRVPIYRTNYLFRGLVVPAGEHTIRMVYRPASVLVGALVTVLALLGSVVALAYTMLRRKQWRHMTFGSQAGPS